MNYEGMVLQGRDLDPVSGRIVIDDGTIMGIEEDRVESTDVILPAFVNAHTHIGDSIAKEAGAGLTLEELVAPPDGLKHRLLQSATRSDLVTGMRQSIRFMQETGTAAFIDFRENGVDGVKMLQEAAAWTDVAAIILGRESEEAMEAGDGFGASSARDGEFGSVRRSTRDSGRLFGIHAGERDSGDINGAFDLDPDFIVHMVHPDPIHLDRLEDRQTPIVVCPRSNLVTGAGVPPVKKLLDRTMVALGTDNVMLNSPSMFRELEFVAKLCDVPARDALRMATVSGAEIAGLDYGCLEAGRDAKLLVLDGESDNLAGVEDIHRAIVRRAEPTDVLDVHLGK